MKLQVDISTFQRSQLCSSVDPPPVRGAKRWQRHLLSAVDLGCEDKKPTAIADSRRGRPKNSVRTIRRSALCQLPRISCSRNYHFRLMRGYVCVGMLRRFDSSSEKSELPIDITLPISTSGPILLNRRSESEIEAQWRRDSNQPAHLPLTYLTSATTSASDPESGSDSDILNRLQLRFRQNHLRNISAVFIETLPAEDRLRRLRPAQKVYQVPYILVHSGRIPQPTPFKMPKRSKTAQRSSNGDTDQQQSSEGTTTEASSATTTTTTTRNHHDRGATPTARRPPTRLQKTQRNTTSTYRRAGSVAPTDSADARRPSEKESTCNSRKRTHRIAKPKKSSCAHRYNSQQHV
ncbi:hypothetical protein EVAR_20266_1 [Eumeta japonica]|uniref:Uncharacterized protein n=1 Tax=Eumeta variegata TaxID=151549 RepID=A0A4C1VQP1_EUMVA|nr:hypothetical protein EVAR_20266_1 [Eumeta japonica]